MTPVVSRRPVLLGLAGIGTLAGLSACGRNGGSLLDPSAIGSAEAARPTSGRIRDLTLRARPVQLDLGGTVVTTWGYGDTVPGTLLRATAGDRVKIAFTNDLPEETSVHWHGLAIRNDLDGVPGVTTTPTPAGGTTAFDFTIPHAGTHWFHPHHGMQLDRGLYAPFIVDDPAEPGGYDHEWVVVLDDWTDGVGKSPEDIFTDLVAAGSDGGMGGMDMGGQLGGMGMGGMDGGAVAYPLYLINGRVPRDPDVLTAKPGQKVRIRIINSAADTIFTVALGGHELSVTHTDGYAVTPVTTSSIRIGMGERYDVVATLGDGVFPFVASPLGKAGIARALVRTGAGSVPAASYLPPEVTAFPLTADALSAAPGTALPKRDPDTVLQVALSGGMQPYVWTINGRTYDQTVPLTISPGQSGRLRITNMSMMSHLVHLHGHTFQLGPAGGSGAAKDTVLVPPDGRDQRRSRRRQPRAVDGPLPQRLPRRSRDDDPPRLRHRLIPCPSRSGRHGVCRDDHSRGERRHARTPPGPGRHHHHLDDAAGRLQLQHPDQHSDHRQLSRGHDHRQHGFAAGSASDIAFAQLMIPHHEQAVQMADLAEKFASSAQVKAMAAQIKAAQTPEIERMTTWLATWGQPTTMPSSSDGSMGGMDMGGKGADSGLMSDTDINALTQARGPAFDRTWLLMMIAHHQSAIAMAQEVLATTTNPDVKSLATSIHAGQATEVSTMKQLLAG